jgi:hypothetical protein
MYLTYQGANNKGNQGSAQCYWKRTAQPIPGSLDPVSTNQPRRTSHIDPSEVRHCLTVAPDQHADTKLAWFADRKRLVSSSIAATLNQYSGNPAAQINSRTALLKKIYRTSIEQMI